MSLKDITDKAYHRLFGNRVTILGASIAVLPYCVDIQNDTLLQTLIMVSSPLITGLGGALLGSTSFGADTYSHYIRAEKHIKKFGELKPKYVQKLIEGSTNRKFFGYCELQGVYLAAKKYGQLDVFNEVKKSHSNNILPNF